MDMYTDQSVLTTDTTTTTPSNTDSIISKKWDDMGIQSDGQMEHTMTNRKFNMPEERVKAYIQQSEIRKTSWGPSAVRSREMIEADRKHTWPLRSQEEDIAEKMDNMDINSGNNPATSSEESYYSNNSRSIPKPLPVFIKLRSDNLSEPPNTSTNPNDYSLY